MEKIIVKGIKYTELENSMPLPAGGGMTILDEDTAENLEESFLYGNSLKVYTPCEDMCTINYGGLVKLEYWVNKYSMDEYETDIKGYIEFIIGLKNTFPYAEIKVTKLTNEERRLLMLGNLNK